MARTHSLLRSSPVWMTAAALIGYFAFFGPDFAYSVSKEPAARKTEFGLASYSYYSRRFQGKETALAHTFRNDELVAAHARHPLGTKVRVTNLHNGRSVVVRITDRGASSANRSEGVIIELSQAAASRLKMKQVGRTRVRVKVLEWGEDQHTHVTTARAH
jgi:rare lipoprotein A